MTTVDPDTLARDPDVLKDIVRRFGGRLALDAEVVRGGTVRVGDEVVLEDPRLDQHTSPLPQRPRVSITGSTTFGSSSLNANNLRLASGRGGA
jgi:hypothetical protein